MSPAHSRPPIKPSKLVGSERQAVAEEHPLERDHPQHDEALLERGQHVLAPDHAAVEEAQAGRHQHHQGGADQHEGRVGPVDGRGGWRRARRRPRAAAAAVSSSACRDRENRERHQGGTGRRAGCVAWSSSLCSSGLGSTCARGADASIGRTATAASGSTCCGDLRTREVNVWHKAMHDANLSAFRCARRTGMCDEAIEAERAAAPNRPSAEAERRASCGAGRSGPKLCAIMAQRDRIRDRRPASSEAGTAAERDECRAGRLAQERPVREPLSDTQQARRRNRRVGVDGRLLAGDRSTRRLHVDRQDCGGSERSARRVAGRPVPARFCPRSPPSLDEYDELTCPQNQEREQTLPGALAESCCGIAGSWFRSMEPDERRRDREATMGMNASIAVGVPSDGLPDGFRLNAVMAEI